ncbi:hypothetical protein AMK59_3584 [Oryctes borbonicus]|uniref:Uncharacterized protein n=1 Tax=Oryctes borbonicus TaxID=1629725 RepID=A0A0T6B7Q8_9SCAR|nr:hypothetical protein AMK59_3584 [Oryctes borbonicus]
MPGKCNKDGLLTQLKELVKQIDDGDKKECCEPCCQPVSPACELPFAQVCFTCPPCIPLPTSPCPVKPLQLPCPQSSTDPQQTIQEERDAYNSRYDNFYNNYNIDYHEQAIVHRDQQGGNSMYAPARQQGVTVDGKRPHCEDYLQQKKNNGDGNKGCPTGFKPCSMRLFPPQCCNPIAPWGATIMPCPPKPPKPDVSTVLPPPELCTRPGCKHWKPEGGPCLYDDPCKAHCFNHPIGMKPSGRYP